MTWQVIMVVIAILAVLSVLFWGLITMARGGEINLRRSNMLMRWRVGLQALAIAIIVIMVLFGGQMTGF